MTRKRRIVALTAAFALLLAVTILLPRLAYRPNTGPGVFDSKEAFDTHIAGLRLETLELDQAGTRLAGDGFRCDLLAPGNLSCHRKVKGSNCGEQQFVDLFAGPGNASRLRVTTRFGLTCT